MPFYDYKCKSCGYIEADIWEMPSDNINKLHKCNKCGGNMYRLIGSIVGINYKNLPKGHNLSATKRRELFNSTDPKEFRQVL